MQGGVGSISGQGSRSRMLQRGLKSPCAATNTRHSQINYLTTTTKKDKAVTVRVEKGLREWEVEGREDSVHGQLDEVSWKRGNPARTHHSLL